MHYQARASSGEAAPTVFWGCAWEEAKRGTPPRTGGRESFTRCQPRPAAPPKGQESSMGRGLRSPRPGENHPSAPWMHPGGIPALGAPSTAAKQETLQSPSEHGHGDTTVPRRVFFKGAWATQSLRGVGDKPRMRDFMKFAKNLLMANIFSMEGMEAVTNS